jgi:hypothetical protein
MLPSGVSEQLYSCINMLKLTSVYIILQTYVCVCVCVCVCMYVCIHVCMYVYVIVFILYVISDVS